MTGGPRNPSPDATTAVPDQQAAGGPPPWIAVIAIGGLVLGALLIGLQLLGVGVIRPEPSPTIAPAGDAAQRTWAQAAAALQAQGFQVQEPQVSYRPGESPALADVPRRLLQAILPSDPRGGYVVIYELPSSDDAERVGREFATYLSSGTGAIQYPRDTRFVLRRAGQTLLFFPWSAEANPDPRLAELAGALGSVGEPVAP